MGGVGLIDITVGNARLGASTFHHATLRVAPHRYATREPLGTSRRLSRVARMVRRFRALLLDFAWRRRVSRPRQSNTKVRRSVGAESTFSQNLNDYGALAKELQPLIDKVSLSGTTASPPVPGVGRRH
jgi:hypothetical protein